MMRTALITSLVLTGFVSAQASSSIFVPDNLANAGNANVIPFGNSKTSTTWANQKYQTLIPASYAKGVPVQIRDLGFAPSSSNAHNFETIVIRMAVVPLKQTTLNATFATNLPKGGTVVLNAKNYTWNLKANTWTRIGLQKSFLWIPVLGNLVIDIEVRKTGGLTGSTGGFHRSNTIERKYAYGWTTTPPTSGNASVALSALKIELVTTDADASAFGQGCKGSAGVPTMSFTGTPKIGTKLSINVANAKKGVVALHILGVNSAAPLLPLDLKPFGAAGCPLYVTPDLAFTVPTGTGAFTVTLPIPNDTNLIGSRFWNQFFILDTGVYKFPYVASNFGRILMGK